MLHIFQQCQGLHEDGQIVSTGMKLEPDFDVVELAAVQPGPLDGVFAFFDPLLGRSPLVEQGDDPFGWTARVGNDESHLRIKFAGIPLDLIGHPGLPIPRAGSIVGVGVGNAKPFFQGAPAVWRRK